MISEIAAQSLPEEILNLLRTLGAVRAIGELGREFDRSKGSGNPYDAERDPGHFVDLSDDLKVLAAQGLRTSAGPGAYDTELRKADKAGDLPYAIMNDWQHS